MNFDFSAVDTAFEGVAEYLKKEYLQISTGRANPGLLDGVMVDSYGSLQPIKNIASINLEDARTMKVSPWDKNQIQDIERALHDSQMPFSVSVDDTGVRISIPQLTEESKQSIVKLVKEKLEEARVKVRNIRQDAMKDIDAGEYSDDAKASFKDELQEKVDTINRKLEEVFSTKKEDIMKV
jgi:ribosome recycling factor